MHEAKGLWAPVHKQPPLPPNQTADLTSWYQQPHLRGAEPCLCRYTKSASISCISQLLLHNKPFQNSVANNTIHSFSGSKIYSSAREILLWAAVYRSAGEALLHVVTLQPSLKTQPPPDDIFFSMQKLEAPRGASRNM